jgi:hypothetical protein
VKPELADRVFRLGTRWANFYLVVEGSDATLVRLSALLASDH